MKIALMPGPRVAVLTDAGAVDVSAAFADIRYRAAADFAPRMLAALQTRRDRVAAMAAQGRAEPVGELLARRRDLQS